MHNERACIQFHWRFSVRKYLFFRHFFFFRCSPARWPCNKNAHTICHSLTRPNVSKWFTRSKKLGNKNQHVMIIYCRNCTREPDRIGSSTRTPIKISGFVYIFSRKKPKKWHEWHGAAKKYQQITSHSLNCLSDLCRAVAACASLWAPKKNEGNSELLRVT